MVIGRADELIIQLTVNEHSSLCNDITAVFEVMPSGMLHHNGDRTCISSAADIT